MAIDFPNSPTNGQTFTVGSKTWTYSSAENQWLLSSVSPDSGTLTTKGDLLTRSSSALVRLPVGSNGDLLVADSGATEGLRWQGQANTGRNVIINGGFDVWQRGTTFTPASGTYTADRHQISFNGSGATRTISRQAFTPGSAPQSGYEAQYFLRYDQSVAGTSGTFSNILQNFENVRLLTGQTIQVSVWAKSASNTQFAIGFNQDLGSGGSGYVSSVTANFTTSTSWQRFSASLSIPSLSGKTIGTNAYTLAYLKLPINSTFTLDFWGWQIEPGSVTTRFEELPYAQTLRNCQRYYYRFSTSGSSAPYSMFGFTTSATESIIHTKFPVTMRTAPTALEQTGTASHYRIYSPATSANCSAVPAFNNATAESAITSCTLASGQTAGQGCVLTNGTGGAASYLAWSAEL